MNIPLQTATNMVIFNRSISEFHEYSEADAVICFIVFIVVFIWGIRELYKISKK